MRNKDIYMIAAAFRSAIIEAKYNREFDSKDRMCNFPKGCCDDSCDLLAYYLYEKYEIYTEQGNGRYSDSNPYNTTNHAWLVLNEDTIIDITGDQFRFCENDMEEVYVGKEKEFYKKLDGKHYYENCDIKQDARLWNDYKIILRYMSEEFV